MASAIEPVLTLGQDCVMLHVKGAISRVRDADILVIW